jgi:hypothetical protein
MSNIEYQKKYVKYKTKYLSLKRGTSQPDSPVIQPDSPVIQPDSPVIQPLKRVNPFNKYRMPSHNLNFLKKKFEPININVSPELINDCKKICVTETTTRKDFFKKLAGYYKAQGYQASIIKDIKFLWEYGKLTQTKYKELIDAINDLTKQLDKYIDSVVINNVMLQFNGSPKKITSSIDWVEAVTTLYGFNQEYDKIKDSIYKGIEKKNITYAKTTDLLLKKEISNLNEYCTKQTNCLPPCSINNSLFKKQQCIFKPT